MGRRRPVLALGCLAACLALLAAGCTESDGDDEAAGDSAPTSAPREREATVGTATVTELQGPDVSLESDPTIDLATQGYRQSEFQLSGTATAYTAAGALGPDGEWTVEPGSQAAYTTRIVVQRPADDADFNGTVIVEWLNVTGGLDASPDLNQAHVELYRRGYAWVGVSAQKVGVDALTAPPNPAAPTSSNPQRYAALSHPGDSYSYDMYSQAGQAVWQQADQVLGGLEPARILAIGESQSAGRLLTYIDAVHPLARVFDGFLVHSRFLSGAALSQDPLPPVAPEGATRIRADLGVPVLSFQTETDSPGILARQPDTETFRLWETAGTSHFDRYGLLTGPQDAGDEAGASAWFDGLRNPTTQAGPLSCAVPVNSGPQTYLLRAAVRALDTWVTTGEPPASAPRLEVADGADPTDQTVSPYRADEHGIAIGGVRHPAVDAPVAVLSGGGQPTTRGDLGNQNDLQRFCFLFGTTVPFTADQLRTAYPDHDAFVRAWRQASDEAVDAGHLLPEDAELLETVAEQARIPS